MRELFVDNFAGGGGASTGIRMAIGRDVDIAVNHDPDAIIMHRTNHPTTTHYQESVWDIDPVKVCGGNPVALGWFSPDCKHFSKAKGAPLVDRNIRGLSWVILRWAMTVRPRVIMMENVEEIQTWGPLMYIGKNSHDLPMYVPDPDRKGETFKAFIGMLGSGLPEDAGSLDALDEACEFLGISKNSEDAVRLMNGLGYKIEFKELVAADYGAPTTRKRFVLIARSDGQPIVWPEKTHTNGGCVQFKNGESISVSLPWVSAASVIDWSIPTYSIFATKQDLKDQYGINAVRPLANNTLRRIIRGVDKFTIKSGKPFIVQCNHSGGDRTQDLNTPLPTISSHHGFGVCSPVISPVVFSNTGHSVGDSANMPVGVVRTSGGLCLSAANLIQYHTEQTENARVNNLSDPLPTVDSSNRYGMTTAHLTEYYGNGNPIDPREPMRTVTSHDREALTCVHIVKFKGTNLGQDVTQPLQTVTASAGEFAVAEVLVKKYAAGTNLGYWPEIRALLNQHCGYNLADDEVLLLKIDDALYYISDISLRMLTPRELYRAMGFPEDYIIDHDDHGKPYPKTKQVARCGNAVSPPMAAALVRANLPEYCTERKRKIA